MSRATLHDRLRRLRRTGEVRSTPEAFDEGSPQPEPDARSVDPRTASVCSANSSGAGVLVELEKRLLGASSGDALSLKERLERLVAVTRQSRPPETRRALVPLEELVHGMRKENALGEFFVMENDVHLDVRHGTVPLSRFHSVEPGSVAILTGDELLDDFDLRRAVFLDTETTGLAGGAGTAAFLIGLAWVEDDRFRVRQYFMRDYHEEAALLHELAEDLSHFDRLVTFNGKMFDVPLLEARFRLNRLKSPLGGMPHLDLLHPARRLWKARLDSCRLMHLEACLLGIGRVGDIPGDQIPEVYFDWVRRRDARALARVFEHNRQDLVSLAALSVLACQWVEEACAEDPRDVLSLARVLERAGLVSRSETEYRRALEGEREDVRGAALVHLALRAKRSGDHETARDHWSRAAESGDLVAMRELAMLLEHRVKDVDEALRLTERGLALAAASRDPRARQLERDLLRRRERLARKKTAGG